VLDRVTIDILENFFDNIIVYDHKGMLLYACDKFWKDTGLSFDEFRGKGIPEIKALDIYKPYCAEIAYLTNEKATFVQTAFGQEIGISTALPIKDKNGETILIITYAENNNQITELEDKLQQLSQLLEERSKGITKILEHAFRPNVILGGSTEVLKIRKLIDRVASIDANILLTGETGVGKTLFAKRIHSESHRKDLPFVEINCAAIPEALLESELFGYEKGAFTGALDQGKEGLIETAAHGTLFLDEISEMSLPLQSKLLKVIQDKKNMRIGGTKSVNVDFRLITAANRDLKELVNNGHFRADLYYRLNVIPIEIPPLRNRREDIAPLLKHFLNDYNEKYGEKKHFDREAIAMCERYSWPGNVRELQNVIERLVLTAEDDRIGPEHLRFHGLPDPKLCFPGYGDDSLAAMLDEKEHDILRRALRANGGNISGVSRELRMSRQSVLRRIKKYGISFNRGKSE
jgi:transcriptional regulator with PAS, ATPase and Fis domain